ncbi:DUF3710 domain-containing protein [Vallicoccus soli]|uniref:DUF3710 domain-containing protein n=1 Tax=Vallicoccus soli TaxID=2339232 RepID=A0A3A3YXY0_9ACTN|nr:DUF3710 domain-containing protein [Vallicoccus soli]
MASAADGAEDGPGDGDGGSAGPGAPGAPGGAGAPPRAAGAVDRSGGPFDVTEVDDPAEGGRVDLGGIWLPGVQGMELRVEMDQSSQQVVSVAAVLGQGAVQVQAFAAPRTEGVWSDVRREIAQGILGQGGRAGERQSALGTELLAEVPVRLPDGQVGRQAVRFVGVDGPRWFLRGVFSGVAAVDPAAAEPLEALFRGIVVVRGGTAMAPREPIPLRLPPQAQVDEDQQEQAPAEEGGADDAGAPARDDLKPFERGPEITEVR